MAGPAISRALLILRQRFLLVFVLAVLVALAVSWVRSPRFPYQLETTMRSARPGFAQLFYDTGAGYNESDSSRVEIEGGGRDARYRFALPPGVFSHLRFDPTDRAGNTMTLSSARILDNEGRVLRVIAPAQFK